MTDLNSRPFHPDPSKCCEACVFGRGEHAEFCAAGLMALVIPADCEFCTADECGDFEAIGYLPMPTIKRAICGRCFAKLRN